MAAYVPESGKPIQWHLNRLACTLANSVPTLDAQGAANVWADTTSEDLALLGALNRRAGYTDRRQFKALQGAANAIAGTAGLGVPAALAQIPDAQSTLLSAEAYWDANRSGTSGQSVANAGTAGALLPLTVGSTTGADSNDPLFLAKAVSDPAYVYLPGVNGNYLSVPSSAPLQITGDIDLRAYAAMDTWVPSASTYLLRRDDGDPNRHFRLTVETTGKIMLTYYPTGSVASAVYATSSVATGITAGAAKWVRATLTVNNGASGSDVKFYLSDDGVTWTQLGTTVTTAGAFTFPAITAALYVSYNGGALAGKVYRTQILNGINGTTVLDVDTSVLTSGSATSFAAKTGQTVTINRSTSGRKSVAVVAPVWLFGTDDYMEVNNRWVDGTTRCVYLPGVTGNYMSVPDSAALDIVGDIDIRARVALDDWTPAAVSALVAKYVSTGDQRSYRLYVSADGKLHLAWSPNGTSPSVIDVASTVATGVTDGATKWVRATLDVDNGAVGNDVKFYTSDDGTAWTQLGTTVTTAGVTSIYAGTAPGEIGAYSGGTFPPQGRIFRAIIFSDLTSTNKVLDVDTSVVTAVTDTTFTAVTGQTVTINGSGTGFVSTPVVESGYVFPTGAPNLSASSVSLLDFGASQDFTVFAVLRSWNNPAAAAQVVGKGSYGGSLTYALTLVNTGVIGYIGGASSAATYYYSNVATSVAMDVLALTRTGATLATYKNGTALGTNAAGGVLSSSLANALPVRIGRRSDAGADYADMELLGVAIFRRALTALEITEISNYFSRTWR